jgi:predicted enzyme related to lactoylglutathione lyase
MLCYEPLANPLILKALVILANDNIMVDSVAATVDVIVANGGEIVQPIGADAPEITARFRGPAGNVVGLYQQPG